MEGKVIMEFGAYGAQWHIDAFWFPNLEALWTPSFWVFIEASLIASLVAQMVKNPRAMQETQVQSLGQEDPLEKRMASQTSILAWRLAMDRGAWRAAVHGLERVGHNWATNTHIT